MILHAIQQFNDKSSSTSLIRYDVLSSSYYLHQLIIPDIPRYLLELINIIFKFTFQPIIISQEFSNNI